MQTFQDVECKPSAQPRYVGMFTVLRFLHLCLPDSLRVKSLQASVLAEALQPVRRRQLPFVRICSSDHVQGWPYFSTKGPCGCSFWFQPSNSTPDYPRFINGSEASDSRSVKVCVLDWLEQKPARNLFAFPKNRKNSVPQFCISIYQVFFSFFFSRLLLFVPNSSREAETSSKCN